MAPHRGEKRRMDVPGEEFVRHLTSNSYRPEFLPRKEWSEGKWQIAHKYSRFVKEHSVGTFPVGGVFRGGRKGGVGRDLFFYPIIPTPNFTGRKSCLKKGLLSLATDGLVTSCSFLF